MMTEICTRRHMSRSGHICGAHERLQRHEFGLHGKDLRTCIQDIRFRLCGQARIPPGDGALELQHERRDECWISDGGRDVGGDSGEFGEDGAGRQDLGGEGGDAGLRCGDDAWAVMGSGLECCGKVRVTCSG